MYYFYSTTVTQVEPKKTLAIFRSQDFVSGRIKEKIVFFGIAFQEPGVYTPWKICNLRFDGGKESI